MEMINLFFLYTRNKYKIELQQKRNANCHVCNMTIGVLTTKQRAKIYIFAYAKRAKNYKCLLQTLLRNCCSGTRF